MGNTASFAVGWTVTVLASFAMPGSLRRSALIYISVVFIAFSACYGIQRVMLPDTPAKGLLPSTAYVVVILFICWSVVPMLLAVDGVRWAQHKEDLARLGQGFSGSILESSCAVESDKVN